MGIKENLCILKKLILHQQVFFSTTIRFKKFIKTTNKRVQFLKFEADNSYFFFFLLLTNFLTVGPLINYHLFVKFIIIETLHFKCLQSLTLEI